MNKNKKQQQGPLETPEQTMARRLLMDYANTGKVGDIRMGEELGIPLGDFNMAGTERMGLDQLNQLITSGNPAMYDTANAGIRDLMDTSEAGLDRMFSPYKALAEREGRNAMDAAKRGSAFTGNLYSTDAVRKIGDVSAKTNETNLATLAGLTNQALNRKLQATGLAQDAGSLEEQVKRQRINDAMTLGARERELNNQKVNMEYQEKLRRRQEIMGQLNAAGSVVNSNTQFGVGSVDVAQPNPYMDFLSLITNAGANYLGSRAGRNQGGTYYGPSYGETYFE